MIGKVLKAFAYYKAPRTTFSVLHPKKAAVLTKMQWDLKHAPAPRLTAVGAAAIMLPLGVIIGRFGRPAGPRANPVRRPYKPAPGGDMVPEVDMVSDVDMVMVVDMVTTDIDLDEEQLV